MATTGIGGGDSTVVGGGGGTGDGNYATAKTSVWWDIENCQVPKACDAHLIAKNISSALAAMDYRGPVSISAYGDTRKINASVQQALSSTGIALNHVPAGVKDASDKKILVDMLFWAFDNPPPANIMLISGDRDFSNALHQLSMRRYNILLAQPRDVSQALAAAAKTVWYWTDLLAGGPPFSLASHTSENGSSSETSRNSTVEVRRPADPSSSNSNLAYQKAYVNEKADSQVKGRQQAPRIQSQPNANKSRIARNECVQYHSESQSLASMIQISKTSNYSDNNNPSIPQQSLTNSPHKCNESHKPELRAAKPSTMEPCTTNDKVSASNNFNDSQCPPHSLNQLGMVASRPYQQLGNYTHSSSPMLKPYAQSTWHNAPVFVKQSRRPNTRTISAQCPNAFHHNTLPYPEEANTPQNMIPNMQGSDVSWSPSGPLVVQSSMETIILSALRILREEKMPPTEANITDCIRYGELKIQDFDGRKALEFAIRHHVVVMLKLGGIIFYVGNGESLWKCVNVMDSQVRHPKAVCDAVLRFLSSTDGHASMMASRCMYEAAAILKRACLRTHALGEILQILNAAIHQKKWILPHSSGWQPLSLLLPAMVASGTNAEPPCS